MAACHVLGGAVGERELETLQPAHLVERVHALVFAGGSAFGLDAATGVMRWCEEHGIGYDTGAARVPIIPAAILFDLRIGSATRRPDAAMGYEAAQAANSQSAVALAEGNYGAGTGCTVGKLFGMGQAMKCGIGCWSEPVPGGGTISALAAVNAFGDVLGAENGRIVAGTRQSAASPELLDTAAAMRHGATRARFGDTNTALVAVATDVALTRIEASRVARMSREGSS